MRDLSSKRRVAVQHLRAGPIAPFLEVCVERLRELGYRPSSIQSEARFLRAFDCWMRRHRLGVADLGDGTVRAFLGESRGRRGGPRGSARALRRLLQHLRESGVIATPAAVLDASPLAQFERRYEKYLRVERGLSSTTIQSYLVFCRQFLAERRDAAVALTQVNATEVAAFVRRHVHVAGPGRAKLMVTALRALCRFLFQSGDVDVDLSGAVPCVPDWRLTTIPKALPPSDVERLLAACPRHTASGRRDRAILLLLARLGLRAGEVVALELDDIDWRDGVIIVRGTKSLRHDRLPLPADVGRALASYLRRGRPTGMTRRVFVTARAPRGSLARGGTVTGIVQRALTRAGLQPAVHGAAHLLRHSLATQLLRRGASLSEIGQVLRHRAVASTEIYAKVDLDRLRVLARPWPETEGGR